MYVHVLPTTGAISFQDFLQSGTTLTSELARATELRASLRSVLKEQRHEKRAKVDEGNGDEREARLTDKDWFKIVKVNLGCRDRSSETYTELIRRFAGSRRLPTTPVQRLQLYTNRRSAAAT